MVGSSSSLVSSACSPSSAAILPGNASSSRCSFHDSLSALALGTSAGLATGLASAFALLAASFARLAWYPAQSL